jgi:hypothetical protein
VDPNRDQRRGSRSPGHHQDRSPPWRAWPVVAGREAQEKAQGRPLRLGATGEGKTERVNASEPSLIFEVGVTAGIAVELDVPGNLLLGTSQGGAFLTVHELDLDGTVRRSCETTVATDSGTARLTGGSSTFPPDWPDPSVDPSCTCPPTGHTPNHGRPCGTTSSRPSDLTARHPRLHTPPRAHPNPYEPLPGTLGRPAGHPRPPDATRSQLSSRPAREHGPRIEDERPRNWAGPARGEHLLDLAAGPHPGELVGPAAERVRSVTAPSGHQDSSCDSCGSVSGRLCSS